MKVLVKVLLHLLLSNGVVRCSTLFTRLVHGEVENSYARGIVGSQRGRTPSSGKKKKDIC